MRHLKSDRKKRHGAVKSAGLIKENLDGETRSLIREIMDPYWSWRFVRSCGM